MPQYDKILEEIDPIPETGGGQYDVVIVGGGLAGLSLSILLAKKGHTVIVLEKEQYPFHKVCGEYISLESRDFLTGLGVDLDAMNVSVITTLQVSSVKGKLLSLPLPLGGFGISRYVLDYELVKIAKRAGVTVKEQEKVKDVLFNGQIFSVATSKHSLTAKVVCACYGKRSNLDAKWKRSFAMAPKNKLNNYVGIKYHIRTNFPLNTIALHNFKNGYCGIVKVEDDKYCLCYLTTAANLQISRADIKEMENTVVCVNPHLRKIWRESEFLYDEPLVISQISFGKKTQVEDHILLTGDAAGMITPLCGNGMSMALHAGKIASGQIGFFLQGLISRDEMEKRYAKQWQKQFGRRLKTGRIIQRLFSNNLLPVFIPVAKHFPFLLRFLIRQTHGKPF